MGSFARHAMATLEPYLESASLPFAVDRSVTWIHSAFRSWCSGSRISTRAFPGGSSRRSCCSRWLVGGRSSIPTSAREERSAVRSAFLVSCGRDSAWTRRVYPRRAPTTQSGGLPPHASGADTISRDLSLRGRQKVSRLVARFAGAAGIRVDRQDE